MTYVIAQPCVDIKDRACVTECPVDCIHEGSRTLYINPVECVDCHACEPVCPVEAIFYEDDLPQHWAHYRSVNAEFLAAATPGQRHQRDTLGDHPLVAALPPQNPHKKEISVFAVRKEEAADADLWFPS
ncbi:ferredoxin [Streptomyces chromofuscus]|uniref:Ferredoxin n=1 Tax=Streptomyces chromofuscus TaxID=42881 RepID=A0A7M2TD01_STRCW|nr:ferredoxin [Streptomyces chromofuscus]QOV45191.1 ferredoxin family protein [Streptomyces chromofuscus]GGS99645.1 ferredoxin [Streptomyces chromofuscus]